MKCGYDREKIIHYIEGGLSTESKEEVKKHIGSCAECADFYNANIAAQTFAGMEVKKLEEGFHRKVMGAIDPQRYQRKGSVFKMKGTLMKWIPGLKPALTIAAACIVVAFVSYNYQYIVSKLPFDLSEIQKEAGSPAASPDPVETNQVIVAKNRPETKMDTLVLEGMEEQHKFTLVTDDALELSTYIPEGMATESVSTDKADALFIYANFNGNENRGAWMCVFSPKKGTYMSLDTDTVIDVIKESAAKGGFTVVGLKKDMKGETATAVSSSINIFTDKERQYCIATEYPAEYGDGMAPRVEKMMEDMMWYYE